MSTSLGSRLASSDLQEKRRSRWFLVVARTAVLVAGLLMLAAVGRVAAIKAASAATAVEAGAPALVATLPASEPVDAGPVLAPPAPPQAPPARESNGRATADDPVYVNYASAEQLRRLPGVGPKRAEAIVALRGRLGRFQRVEDLLRVKGIGRATLKKLRPLVRLDAPEAGTL